MPKCPMSYHSQFDELNFEPFLHCLTKFFSQIFVKINIKLLQRKKNSQKWVRWGLENGRRFVAKNCEIFWQEFQLQTPIFCHFANQSGCGVTNLWTTPKLDTQPYHSQLWWAKRQNAEEISWWYQKWHSPEFFFANFVEASSHHIKLK